LAIFVDFFLALLGSQDAGMLGRSNPHKKRSDGNADCLICFLLGFLL